MLYHKRLFHAIIMLLRTRFDIGHIMFYNDLKYSKKILLKKASMQKNYE